ncbi:MAG: DNA polymerase III subunit gamma/tau [Clostridia bacterium]|nr:DNA polymerase III subunit gamma/tau [Clostridia bacterium]
MGYTALYRKFRPMRFDEIVGQEHIVKTLKNQILADRIGHAYLFNGGRGTGKTSAAKVLARAVNCLNPQNGEPCNECEICRSALDGSLTDIVEMDAASNNSVEDVREIREAVNFLPTTAKYRVYIIDEVHMLSTGAFNALLKTLEEPPKHVKFILATTEPQKIPATILSRCQRFDFKRISNEDIIKRLEYVCKESNIEISQEALNLVATLAEGGMRDALSILERCNQDGEDKIDGDKIRNLVGIPKITFIKQITQGILEKSVTDTLDVVETVLKEGKDLNNLLWEIIKYVKDILLFKSTGKTETYSSNEIEDIKALAEKASKEELIDLICNLSELENNMKLSTQKLIIFQTGLIKLCNNMSMKNDSKREENSNNNNSALEARVTKIENFLRAGNFVKNSSPKYSIETSGSKEKVVNKIPEKPRYQGKTQDYWPNLVNDFKRDGKMFMYVNLAGTIAKEINDMTLAIEFPNGISQVAKDFLERPENRRNLHDTIQIASGKDMQIKFIDTKPEMSGNAVSEFETFASNTDIPFNVV